MTLRYLPLIVLNVALLSLGCSNGDQPGGAGGGTGGVPGTGGNGGNGGVSGVGGQGGGPLTCELARDCDDDEPCTEERCESAICAWDPLPDNTTCFQMGVSACIEGECQTIESDCTDEGAVDGDFCRPRFPPDPPRLGRCDADECVVTPCEVDFDCWSGNACQIGICEASTGECSSIDKDDGTRCLPPSGGVCSAGDCVIGGGTGGNGGMGGDAGAGGAGGTT